MRSWNIRACRFWGWKEKRVRNLPMRSWNSIRKGNVSFTAYVRNLPMRSWNAEKHNKVYSEERKFAIYQWGVETTPQQASYRTKRRVRNLPMRSWNFVLSSSFFVSSMFAIYQWGVETPQKTPVLRPYKHVRNLPMRSWNVVGSILKCSSQ